MVIRVSIKELKLIREVVQALNEAFPENKIGIPSQRYEGNKLIKFNAKLDPHFTACKEQDGRWWIYCDDWGVNQEASEFMVDFCNYLRSQGMHTNSCHVHPVTIGIRKGEHREKKVFLWGQVSWC